MSRRTHVPKFGNCDANDPMPYTAVFDHARQGRGKPINPNDPSENPNMFPGGRGNGAPGRRPFNPNDPENSMEAPDLPQEKPQTQGSREGSGTARGQQHHQVAAAPAPAPAPVPVSRRSAAPAAQGNVMPTRVPPGDPRQGSRDNALDRSVENTSTSFSADQSPAHPMGFQSSQGRGGAARRGANSPAWDRGRKSTGEDGHAFAPTTPNRSRLLHSSNKEEAPSKAAVPKFGQWEDDPDSAEGITIMFNKAIQDKKTGGVANPRTPNNNPAVDLYGAPVRQKAHSSKKNRFCWCS